MDKIDPSALEAAWRNSIRKNGPSLFRAIRAARARGEKPCREVVTLHYVMCFSDDSASKMTLDTESIMFIDALLDATVDERDEISRLVKAFLGGNPIDPDSLQGRQRDVAFAFYNELEDQSEIYSEDFELPTNSYLIAKAHQRHCLKALEIKEKTRRKKGETRGLDRRVYRIVDDFLIVVLIAARIAEIDIVFPGDPEDENPFTKHCQSVIDHSAANFVKLAGKIGMPDEQVQQLKIVLSDLNRRTLVDRMRPIIKEFGKIDLKPVI